MSPLRLLRILPGLWSVAVFGQAIHHSDGSPESVQNLHDHEAADGDIITLPDGRHFWASGVVITKGITIQGAGSGGDSVTVIVDDIPNSSVPQFRLNTTAGKRYRITGVKFIPGDPNTGRPARSNAGVIQWTGTGTEIRTDHCVFDRLNTKALRTAGSVCGLFDRNVVHVRPNQTSLWFFHSEWGGGTWGDGSWSAPLIPGSWDAVYVEDNDFIRDPAGTSPQAVTDSYGGARYVFRKNRLVNANLPTHGTSDGAGRHRGLRWFEVYSNEITYRPASAINVFHVRGGTGIWAFNTLVGAQKSMTLHYYRGQGKMIGHFGPIIRPGRTPGVPHYTEWDAFDLSLGEGTGIAFSGTAGPGSTDNRMFVEGAAWPPDQWVGYIVFVEHSSRIAAANDINRAAGARGDLPTHFYSRIRASGPNWIEVEPNNHDPDAFRRSGNRYNGPLTTAKPFAAGDPFSFHRFVTGLDNVGMGRSDPITVRETFPPPENLHQQRQPLYSFGNVLNGAADTMGAKGIIEEDYHYMREVPEYDGSTGMGIGLLKERPEKPALKWTAFFATDVRSHPSSTGTLFRWNGSEWERYWESAPFPHFLASDS